MDTNFKITAESINDLYDLLGYIGGQYTDSKYGWTNIRSANLYGLLGCTNMTSTMNQPQITNVIFNEPATIIFWSDGEKTVVKCEDWETFDLEKGLAMAIAKHALGNKGNYYKEFKKWLPVNI